MMRNEIVDRGLDHQTAGTGITMIMSAGGGGGQRKGSNAVVQQGLLKKGPWTAAEDAILMEYVKKHGEGNWNSVQKNCGLLRCGKSCRLRWANHLRPNLKKGAFTPEEERVIIELHAKYGNKWARMATQLPGRTDNEIKNYWNTRMKRRQRAGLPVYPTEFQDQAAAFHHMQNHEQNHLTNHHTNNNSNKSSSLFSVFRKAPDYTPCFSLSADGLTDFSTTPGDCFRGYNSNNAHLSSSAFYSTNTNTPNHHHYLNTQHGTGLAPLSLSPLVSTFAPPSASPPVTGGGENMASNVMSFTSLIMGNYDDDCDPDQLESFSFASASELPSLQTPPRSVSSNATGGGGGGVCVVAEGSDIANSNNNNNNNHGAGVTKGNDEDTLTGDGGVMGANMVIENNSGLLDALLMESKAICRKRKADEMEIGAISSTAAAEEGNVDCGIAKRSCTAAPFWGAGNDKQQASCDGGGVPRDNLVFSRSSTVMEPVREEETAEEMSSMDDDLLSLLTNFPSSIPLPEWYGDHSTIHNTPDVNMKATATADGTAAAPCGDGGHASPAPQGP